MLLGEREGEAEADARGSVEVPAGGLPPGWRGRALGFTGFRV